MVDQQLIDYLRAKTKGKLLMSPEQLPLKKSASRPNNNQSCETRAAFPIPFKNIGRLVYYSIYDVANFLLNGESTPSKEVPEEATAPIQIKKKPVKSKYKFKTCPTSFMLRAFAQSLEERATAMLSLAEN